MPGDPDRSYFRARAIEERDAAAEASCMVKDVHLELVELYDDLGSGAAVEAEPRSERHRADLPGNRA